MNSIQIIAKEWDNGWELWHEDECLTQVADLAHAKQQIIDYLDTVEPHVNHSEWEINIHRLQALAVA